MRMRNRENLKKNGEKENVSDEEKDEEEQE